MKLYKIKELLSSTFSGYWGEDSNDGNGIQVIRTTNFIVFGRLSFSQVVMRKVKHSVVQRKMLAYGDIIIEKSGGSPTQPVGRVAFFYFS
jgi:type I restriction enzyme S subunit